ncbi:MAG: DUF2062 domain-containing protein [Phycisphaerales bacterium]
MDGYCSVIGRYLDWRGWARTIVAIRETPRQVALGVALGSFIAFTPFIGLQMLLAALVATVAGASKKAAMLAVWISNPVTMGPIFAFTYHLGLLFITPTSASASTIAPAPAGEVTPGSAMTLGVVFEAGRGLLAPLLIGGAVVGLLAAVLGYVLTRRGVEAYQTSVPVLSKLVGGLSRPDNL